MYLLAFITFTMTHVSAGDCDRRRVVLPLYTSDLPF